mmetsp:Transcript_8860/g.15037  ORF Transcript_8860/g.15037 Transcript_8860/m.15037 type:complete len:86 (+) Transcript_8860:218-475(+)
MSSTSTQEIKVPIAINLGKLKINQSGGNVSSAISVASGKKATQEEQVRAGKAQILDTSYVSSATDKQKLDETFQSHATNMSRMTG